MCRNGTEHTSVKIRVRFLLSAVEHCVNTREQSDFVFLFTFCQVKLVSSTNLLCYSVGVSQRRGHPFTFNHPLSDSLLSWHSFCNSCPVSSHPSLSHPRINLLPKCQKCSVRRIRYVPYESVFLLLSN